MLRIEYFDKNRFMKQVAASRGSVILHLDNGSTCDLKKDNEASAIFQTLDAPKKGFSISVSDPLMSPASCAICSRLAAPAENAIIYSSLFIITATGQPRSGTSQSGAVPFCCIFILQDAPADGLRHSQEFFLPDEAELHLVLVGVADRQFRSLQWVAEACRLDAEVNDLPVGQDEDLLPGAGNALHIHNENAVARKTA